MKSIINEAIKENFYIKLHFDTSVRLELAGIKCAYLDFNRTLHKIDETEEQRKKNREETENYLLKNLINLIKSDINSQIQFDEKHKILTKNLTKNWNKLTIGQAQKWINMSLKYWLLFGENRIKSIEKNAKYFHIPIDSYVQKGMFEEKKPQPWSKINDYETYMNYQKQHRLKRTGNYPILDEFLFFNKYNLQKQE